MSVVPIRQHQMSCSAADWSRSVAMTGPADDASSFGAVLRSLRIAAGLSQNALARRAAIDSGYVNRLERQPAQPVRVSRAVVTRCWLAVGGEMDDLDRLLAAAGLLPESVAAAGGWDIYVDSWSGQVRTLEAKLQYRDAFIAGQSRRLVAAIDYLSTDALAVVRAVQ